MWVFDDNLRPFLTILGWVVGYPFDPDDWQAIDWGVRESDVEAGRWYEYEFLGRSPAKIGLARDPGTEVVHVRVQVPLELEPQVALAADVCAHFRVQE